MIVEEAIKYVGMDVIKSINAARSGLGIYGAASILAAEVERLRDENQQIRIDFTKSSNAPCVDCWGRGIFTDEGKAEMAAEVERLRKENTKLTAWVDNDKEIFSVFGEYPGGMTLKDARSIVSKVERLREQLRELLTITPYHLRPRYGLQQRRPSRLRQE